MKLVETRGLPDDKPWCKLQRILTEFLESEMKCAEVVNEGEYKKMTTMNCNLRRAVKDKYADKVSVHCIKDRVYLCRI